MAVACVIETACVAGNDLEPADNRTIARAILVILQISAARIDIISAPLRPVTVLVTDERSAELRRLCRIQAE